MSSEFTQDSMTLTFGTDQEINMQRDCETRNRKGTDGDVSGSPNTKMQHTGDITHSTDPSNNVQQPVSVRKRRASDDGEMPGKKMRCSDLTNPTDPSETGLSVEDPTVETKKRKASDDGDAPEKRKRCSSSSSAVSFNTVSSEPEFCVSAEEDPEDDGAHISYIFNCASVEEEWIFEMSSTGNTSRADFEDSYREFAPLGAGGASSVYAGIRKSDYLPVAIKHIPNECVRCEKVMCNGRVFDVILEVAFMLKTAGPPFSVGQSYAVSLLDWYILDQELVLVMERPTHCMDLYSYLQSCGGSLDEFEAKVQKVHKPFTTKSFIQNDIQINSALSIEVQILLYVSGQKSYGPSHSGGSTALPCPLTAKPSTYPRTLLYNLQVATFHQLS